MRFWLARSRLLSLPRSLVVWRAIAENVAPCLGQIANDNRRDCLAHDNLRNWLQYAWPGAEKWVSILNWFEAKEPELLWMK